MAQPPGFIGMVEANCACDLQTGNQVALLATQGDE